MFEITMHNVHEEDIMPDDLRKKYGSYFVKAWEENVGTKDHTYWQEDPANGKTRYRTKSTYWSPWKYVHENFEYIVEE